MNFNHKKVLIAPHSPMSLALSHKLEKDGINVVGFIDKNKKNTNIFQINNISNISFDYVIIFSPNHFGAIYEEYIQYIEKNKIYKAYILNEKYHFTNNITLSKREIKILPTDINEKREKIVFISKDFIGSNNKALYIYCYKNSIDSIMLTDNLEQLEELRSLQLPCALLDTDEADKEIAYAKFIIFDQGNYTYLPPLHQEQKTIQLWHGVGLKKMSKLTNIKYNYFISTSKWTNETNFQNIFDAENFLACGYPRNDIFHTPSEDNLDTLFCDKNIYNFVKQKDDKKLLLYMPTHRESTSKIPLDFYTLNQELKKSNAYLVVKLHPFVLKSYKNIYSNILFHNAKGDIYPILKYVDILISDYSSVVYDFLLLDRPIIFFNYDMELYQQNVKFLFDYDENSPGIKVDTQEKLLDAIQQKDRYKQKREEIRMKFFDNSSKSSSKNILNKVLN